MSGCEITRASIGKKPDQIQNTILPLHGGVAKCYWCGCNGQITRCVDLEVLQITSGAEGVWRVFTDNGNSFV